MTCNGLSDCDGHCADTTSDDGNCGMCGRACTKYEIALNTSVGGCDTSKCLPTYGDCFQIGVFTNCNQYCASTGESCTTGACYGATAEYYSSNITCRDLDGSANSTGTCGETLDVQVGDWARCCCTDSGV